MASGCRKQDNNLKRKHAFCLLSLQLAGYVLPSLTANTESTQEAFNSRDGIALYHIIIVSRCMIIVYLRCSLILLCHPKHHKSACLPSSEHVLCCRSFAKRKTRRAGDNANAFVPGKPRMAIKLWHAVCSERLDWPQKKSWRYATPGK